MTEAVPIRAGDFVSLVIGDGSTITGQVQYLYEELGKVKAEVRVGDTGTMLYSYPLQRYVTELKLLEVEDLI